MKNETISVQEVKTWLDEKKDFVLVDVMNPEYFAEKHISGSINAPVYEVAFLSYLENLQIPKNKTIVVYNEKKESLATNDAATKLAVAGYVDVYEFPGGLTAWEEANLPLEKGVAVVATEIIDGKYEIDIESSIVGWSGRNAKYAHHGKIAVKYGSISVKDAKVVGGEIALDMKTIVNEDLTKETWKDVLESHLKSPDFFDVEKFPVASFLLSDTTVLKDALGGISNYQMKGVLTIKDVKRPIEFPAMIVSMGDGVLNGQAHFDFDRTLWNVRYGSEKFFEKLGMHLVNDVVSLELFLVAKLVK